MKLRYRTRELPLSLTQVLEEEFLTLHGPLPESYRRAKYSSEDERLSALRRLIHEVPERSSALALSGGGIRSATFALGVVQALADYDLLSRFDYLSTVSGGGYLGGWLTAWIHRHPRGLPGVAEELRGKVASKGSAAVGTEPAPVRHLRSFSNYLSPKLGLLSLDTWTLIATYLRNLLLNWLILVPLAAAILLFPRVMVTMILMPAPAPGTMKWVLGIALLLLSAATIFVSLNRPSGERCCAGQGWFIVLCLAPLLVATSMLTLFWCWHRAAGGGFIPLVYLVLAMVGFKAICLVGTDPPWTRVSGWYQLLAYTLTAVLGGALLWVASTVIFPDPARHPFSYTCFAVPLFLLILATADSILLGIASYITEDEDREWWARYAAWVLLSLVLWGSFSSLVIFGPAWFLCLGMRMKALILSAGSLAGIAAVLAAWSSKTPATRNMDTGGSWKGNILNRPALLGALLFTMLLLALVSLGTSWLLTLMSGNTGDFDHLVAVRDTSFAQLGVLTGVLLAVGIFMGVFVNINKFSLHAVYRDRLVRAYLGASRPEGERKPNPFTGFDPDDNVYMSALQPALLNESRFTDLQGFLRKIQRGDDPVSAEIRQQLSPKVRRALDGFDPGKPGSRRFRRALLGELNDMLQTKGLFAGQMPGPGELPEPAGTLVAGEHGILGQQLLSRMLLEHAYPAEIMPHPVARPLHIINVALNLVKGQNLAWQQRKAESFTATSLHSGNYRLGYRRSRLYGGKDGITLGTAMAISGAAASPNMGYHSSPVLTFLMTFFNARLGWWLGNPGTAGWRSFGRPGPSFAVAPMFSEAFGLTDDRGPYVYLSDGGHFENLGLYELVLRRCHFILASDAGEDPDCNFEDLGNATRKIRIDLGVPIEFRAIPIYSRREMKQGSYFAIGSIRYSRVDPAEKDGALLYLKPAFYGGEPADVFHYAKSHPAFPHESTADQWFSESQFESYRALGYYITVRVLEQVCGGGWNGGMDDLIRKIAGSVQ